MSEIKQFIDNQMNFKALEEAIIIKTRQYAKRQRTWFRNKFMSWSNVELSPKNSLRMLAQDIENIH